MWSRRLGTRTVDFLRGQGWPGNVRELQQAVEAAAVVCDGEEILPDHLPSALGAAAPVTMPTSVEPDERLPTLREMEREHVARALRATGGHRGKAAEVLGISERSLYRKLHEYGLLD